MTYIFIIGHISNGEPLASGAIAMVKQDKGTVALNSEECKGCGLCVASCTPGVLQLSGDLNHYGYHYAVYSGQGCSGCGLCFYACPEPGAITVYKRIVVTAADPMMSPVAA